MTASKVIQEMIKQGIGLNKVPLCTWWDETCVQHAVHRPAQGHLEGTQGTLPGAEASKSWDKLLVGTGNPSARGLLRLFRAPGRVTGATPQVLVALAAQAAAVTTSGLATSATSPAIKQGLGPVGDHDIYSPTL